MGRVCMLWGGVIRLGGLVLGCEAVRCGAVVWGGMGEEGRDVQ